MEVLKGVEKAGDQLIDAIRFVQDLTASLVEAVVTPFARRVPELPLPDRLRPPRPKAVAEVAFDFVERLAQSQKEFALRIIEAFDGATRSKPRSAKAA
jgi:hypothetical protein